MRWTTVYVHGGLFVAALVLIGLTAGNEDRPGPGAVRPWTEQRATRVTLVTPERTVTLVQDASGSVHVEVTEHGRAGSEPGEKGPGSDGGSSRVARHRFTGNQRAKEVLEAWASPRASRSLGKVTPSKLKDLGLGADGSWTVTVEAPGGTHRLEIGAEVFGTRRRYAMKPDDGEIYVIEGRPIRDLERATRRLLDRNLVDVDREALDHVRLTADGATVEFVRLGPGSWARAESKDREDEAATRWVDRLLKLSLWAPRALDDDAGDPGETLQVTLMAGDHPLDVVTLSCPPGPRKTPCYGRSGHTLGLDMEITRFQVEDLVREGRTMAGVKAGGTTSHEAPEPAGPAPTKASDGAATAPSPAPPGSKSSPDRAPQKPGSE